MSVLAVVVLIMYYHQILQRMPSSDKVSVFFSPGLFLFTLGTQLWYTCVHFEPFILAAAEKEMERWEQHKEEKRERLAQNLSQQRPKAVGMKYCRFICSFYD